MKKAIVLAIVLACAGAGVAAEQYFSRFSAQDPPVNPNVEYDGRLVFLRNATQVLLCTPLDEGVVDEQLHRSQFGMHRFEWEDGSVMFHLPHGKLLEVLRANGFELERLVELQASDSAETHPYYGFVTAEWARRWPAEEIWVSRKRT